MIEKPRKSAKSPKEFLTKGSGGETGISEIWNGAGHPSAVKVEGEYVTLVEHDAVLPKTARRVRASEPAPRMAKGIATRREDLESGLGDFAVRGGLYPTSEMKYSRL